MSILESLFSTSDPESIVEECTDAMGPIWSDIREELPDRNKEVVFRSFVRHPFVLGTAYGFISAVAQDKGVKLGSDTFNKVLAATLKELVGLEESMELGGRINKLWINPEEGDDEFERGFEKGFWAGGDHIDGIQRGGKVFTIEGVVDRGPPEPFYIKTLTDAYWKVLKKEVL